MTFSNLLKLNFSPIFEVFATTKSFKPSQASASSTVLTSFLTTTSKMASTNSWNSGFFATKSVSEFTSTIAAVFPSILIAASPSAAIRSAFFAAFEIPFSLNQSIEASISPLFASNAFLQSSIPAPVFSLSSFTKLALIIITLLF